MQDLHLNFKILIIACFLLSLSACGVKGPPMKHPETIVDSYVKDYTGAEMTPEEIERTKNQAIPSTMDTQQIKQPTTTKP